MKKTLFSSREFTAALAVAVGGGVILGIIGPFGDYYRLALLERLGLWLIYSAIGSVLFIGGFKLLMALSTRTRALPIPVQLALVSMIAALPMFVIVELIGVALGRPLPSSFFGVILSVFEITIIGLLALTLFHFTSQRLGDGTGQDQKFHTAPSKSSDMPFPEELARELGDGFGDALVCVKAEGHYARAYGNAGDQLIGLSLTTIVALIKDMDEALVHRSWWVARNAIDRKFSRNGSMEIILTNGLRIPVARRRQKELRKDGWLI